MTISSISILISSAMHSAEDKLDFWKNINTSFSDWYENVARFFDTPHLTYEYILYGLSFLAIVCLFYFILTLCRSVRNINNTRIFPVFLFTWIYGVLVYDIGMYDGVNFTLITNFPMAFLYGFKIFLLESDASEVHAHFHENWLYAGNFALVHFLAACVTALFLIKHFGFNVIARLKMWFAASRLSRSIDDTYIFWGLNENTTELVGNINSHYGNSKNYRIVIIRTDKKDEESPEERTGFNRILDFLSIKNSELDKIQSLKCLTSGTYANISEIRISNDKDYPDIIGRELRLKPLTRLIKDKTRSRVHLFFLTPDEQDNIHAVSVLVKDSSLNSFAVANNGSEGKHRVILYCLARKNSVHRVIEEQNSSERIRVKIVDLSSISVEMLKHNEALLPVNFVDVQADATVSSPFNALVIGFSEVGRDVSRFLYEFGAFVRSGSTDSCVDRSEFHLDVVDKNMSDLAGSFISEAPALDVSMPFIEGRCNDASLITLHEADCRSAEFFISLEQNIRNLNYVVVATENDELNISMGVRIFKMALRYRDDMEKFCILVRAHNDDDGHIRRIAQHYNRLWLAEQEIEIKENSDFNQTTITRDHYAPMPICVFGLDRETFTYDTVIDDSLERRAAEYKERYELATNPEYSKPENEEDMAWSREIRRRMQLTEDLSPYNPTYSGLMGLRRKCGQDLANCLHSLTKSLLAQKALAAAGIPSFEWTLMSRPFRSVSYFLASGQTADDKILRILDVLAQTEHLRWNASHEILGYIRHGEEDYRHEVRRHHGCLTSWDKLSPKVRSYDYNVIDLTLDIITPERPIKKN